MFWRLLCAIGPRCAFLEVACSSSRGFKDHALKSEPTSSGRQIEKIGFEGFQPRFAERPSCFCRIVRGVGDVGGCVLVIL